MTHPACEPIPPAEASEHYKHYLDCCPVGDLSALLEEQRLRVLEELGGWDDEAGRLAYAPGKWSGAALLRILVGHCEHHLAVWRERYRPLLPAGRRPLEAQMEQGLSLHQVALSDLTELLVFLAANQTRLGRWLGWAELGIDPPCAG